MEKYNNLIYINYFAKLLINLIIFMTSPGLENEIEKRLLHDRGNPVKIKIIVGINPLLCMSVCLSLKSQTDLSSVSLTFLLHQKIQLLLHTLVPLRNVHVQGVITARLPVRSLLPLLKGLKQTVTWLRVDMIDWTKRMEGVIGATIICRAIIGVRYVCSGICTHFTNTGIDHSLELFYNVQAAV